MPSSTCTGGKVSIFGTCVCQIHYQLSVGTIVRAWVRNRAPDKRAPL